MSLGSLLTQLDPRPAVRGREFERLCAWYLRSAPEYAGRFHNIWLWAEWPGAWAADAGIDLVAEEGDGRLWAIQAKAYDPSYAIKKADVDSFLSESNRPQFSYRLLIATTDRLGATARRTLEAQREPVGCLLRSQLELANVDWPASPDDLRPRRPPRKTPFPHVREAIEATVTGFADHERGQLIMACGTGKTLAAMWIAERLKSTRTLVLVPSLSLLRQTLREWSANSSMPFDYLAVCSDQTVSEGDDFVQHTSELGLPVTTDPELIATFLRGRGRRVVFATYQSSPQIATAQEGRVPAFDLAIADEAHRCAGRVGNEFTTILDGERIKANRRIFMTATPRYYTSRLRQEAGVLDVEVASMDDETAFGPVLHRLSFGEGIQRDLLSDYQVVVVGVDNEMYRAWAEHGEFVTPDGEKVTDARTLAGQIALAKSMRKYNLRRVISFHSRVSAARKFSRDVPNVIAWMPGPVRPRGSIWCEHVSGAMTSGHRDRLLLRFRELAPNERGLLSNARCLGEGVNVPNIDGVAFVDPRRSTIDIVQAVGRAIRKSPDKTLGTILLPVFLPDDEDPDLILDESAFTYVWDVLKALRAHDEELGKELDELRRRLGARRSSLRRPGKIKLDVPAGRVGAEFVDAFNARLVEQTTASWEFWFGLLQRYVERTGHSRVPTDFRDDDGWRLGAWVGNQRQRRRLLSEEQRRRLEALRGWIWDADEAKWEDGYTRLQEFIERNDHSRVPAAYHDADGYPLGSWVGTQRQLARHDRLPAERRRRLESLPGWTVHALDARWEDCYASLLRFVERTGHSRVPADDRVDGTRLGQWVKTQRRRRSTLSAERIRQLEHLPGWTWDLTSEAWEEGYERLRAFVERNGHSRVQADYRDDDGYRLGNWVRVQRRSWNKGDLPQRHRLCLEAQPGWTWNPQEAAWEDGYARLRGFVERHGHGRVPQSYHDDDGYPLRSWAAAQRASRRRGQLSEDRVSRLEALRGWTWNAREANWEAGYGRLLKFVERTGQSLVPDQYQDDEGFKLGHWVREQRVRRRTGQLSDARARRLESIADWTWDPTETAWEESFSRLQRYVDRHGNARVPQAYRDQDDYAVGAWVNGQRTSYRAGNLDPDRRARLEALPGWVWDPYEADWEEAFTVLLRFVDREGNARVPGGHLEDGFRLGQWVGVQRQRYREDRIDQERLARLEATTGWVWEPHEAAWEHGYAILLRYAEREGHARVPLTHCEDGFKLGRWVANQRSRPDDEHRSRLEAVPGWVWNMRDAAWEEGFGHLQRFVEREGHGRVLAFYEDDDGFRLGGWVRRQRVLRLRGKLSDERTRRLESVPGWTWDA
jgi:superfamily II DNA or RNA helicase